MVMKAALFLLIALLSVPAQNITDDDRRGFNELGPITVDIDFDGKPDKIQPRTYQTYRRRPGRRLSKRDIRNWITFDLMTQRGVRIRSLFTYNYGTAEQGGSYWVYALVPIGDLNNDRKMDLEFYAGDDTTDETVKLVSRGSRYVVRYRKK